MKTEEELRREVERITDKDGIRTRLMIASLYMTSFEILKSAIVEQTKENIVGDERVKEVVKEYENAIGISLDRRDQYGLIPTCEWLKQQGVYNDADIEAVRRLREVRNVIAHKLPSLILVDKEPVNAEDFVQLMNLLRKVDIFWYRNSLHFDIDTLNEVDTSDVKDEEIHSGKLMVIHLITDAVIEYIEKMNAPKQDRQ